MAIGKNKRLTKGKKGQKKKTVDSMAKKEWYDFKAPQPFESSRSFGKTCITKTIGTRISTEVIKGRVVETTLSDLKTQADNMFWRKVKLQVEDVEGKFCRTSFHGLDMTRDKICQFIRKWHSLIDIFVDVKTQDGFVMRVFINAFTQKQKEQFTKTSYANHAQVKTIRRRASEILQKAAQESQLTQFVQNLISETFTNEIQKKSVYPLAHVIIRKVKMLKKPKYESHKLDELFVQKEVVRKADKNEEDESKNLLKK